MREEVIVVVNKILGTSYNMNTGPETICVAILASISKAWYHGMELPDNYYDILERAYEHIMMLPAREGQKDIEEPELQVHDGETPGEVSMVTNEGEING